LHAFYIAFFLHCISQYFQIRPNFVKR
jgi:hypothetical protein